MTTRIHVVGAGPGGLTCARILQRHGIPVTVHDRDPHPAARNQGGSLDLHVDDGQLALREAGLLEEFFSRSRPEGQEMRKLSTDGRLLEQHLPADGELTSPEIDRGQLRELLLDSLEPGTVRWGHALAAIDGPDAGPRTLTFTDGTTVEADLVIGADGGFSHVRPSVSPATPSYSGVSFLEAWFDDIDSAHAEVAGLVGNGSAMATDGERALFAQRNSGGHLRVYVVQRVPVEQVRTRVLDEVALQSRLAAEFAQWSPLMRRLVLDHDGPYVERPLYVLPAALTWEHSATVTLLGDAAHLMPPAGVGVNLAMLDACELALAVVRSSTAAEAIRSYETTMFARAAEFSSALEGKADFLLAED